MCQRKPGRRCPSHARSALSSAQRRYDEAVKRVDAVTGDHSQTPPSRVLAAQQRLVAAEANLAAARTDADSTVAGRDGLLTALADDSLSKRKRERLSVRFQHAEALTQARADQRRFMPDLPAERTADMARTYSTLGDSRDSLARVDAELAVTSDKREQRRLEDQRAVLSQRVFAHDVQHRLAATGWRPDSAHVAPDEQRAARQGGMQAHQALTVLSHQRAAVATGGHDEKFGLAVSDAEGAFRRRYLPDATPPAAKAPTANTSTPQRQERAPGAPRQQVTRRKARMGKSVLSASEAKRLMRKATQSAKGEKVTPGKHLSDPILPDLT